MSNAIGDILSGSRPQEPVEFDKIRRFVQHKFEVTPKLQLQHQTILITVPSAAIAGSLHLELFNLEKKLGSNKRLRIRIGR